MGSREAGSEKEVREAGSGEDGKQACAEGGGGPQRTHIRELWSCDSPLELS